MIRNLTRQALWLLATVLVVALVGCSKSETEGQGEVAETAQTTPPAAATDAALEQPAVITPPSGPLAATVNGLPVSVGEVQRVAYNLRRQGLEPDENIQADTEAERIYLTARKRLIEQRVIQAAATERGVVVTQGDILAGLERIKSQSGGEEAFQHLLDENRTTMADVERDVQASIYIRGLFERVLGEEQPPVSEAEMRAFYDENPQHFASKKEINARHILLLTQPEMSDMDKAGIRAQLAAILKRVRSGEDFATVANETTQDPTNAGKGGDLGWFGPGMMVPPFNDAAFALSDGQISDIVETQFGFHIIKKEGERLTDPTAFEIASPQIEQYLAQQKAQDIFQAFVDSMTTVYDIKLEDIAPETLTGF